MLCPILSSSVFQSKEYLSYFLLPHKNFSLNYMTYKIVKLNPLELLVETKNKCLRFIQMLKFSGFLSYTLVFLYVNACS